MLEVLVHLGVATIPRPFQLIEVEAPDAMTVTDWPEGADASDPRVTTDWGDAFLAAGHAAFARVPSRVAPGGWNRLLNPLHPDAAQVAIVATARWPWDARLFRA